MIQTYLTPRAFLFFRFPSGFFTIRRKTLDRFNQQTILKTYEVIRALHNLFISQTSLRRTVVIGQSQFSPDNETLLGRSKTFRWFKGRECLLIKHATARLSAHNFTRLTATMSNKNEVYTHAT